MKKYYGKYGGVYVPEVLLPAIENVEKHYSILRKDKKFWKQLDYYFKNYSGRPTPLSFAENLTKHFGGPKIYIKREDLNHTGAHKINNVLGQMLLAKHMGKKRIITETGAGQNGLAVATCAAKFGFECIIYMGKKDIDRQQPNARWMKLLGATVVPVTNGTSTLKDAGNAALRDWITNVKDTHYVIGSALGPAPFPQMVKDFQSVIGKEAKMQIKKQEGRLADHIFACVGGGSNSIGIFSKFLNDKKVKLYGVEAGGENKSKIGKHAARIDGVGASDGIFQGYFSKVLQDNEGQVSNTSSVSAGLDYAGIGPEHAYLSETGRVKYISVNDKEAIDAFKLVASKEGIIPALESAHAFAGAFREIKKMRKGEIVIINQSGRGDKDIFIVNEALKDKTWIGFLEEELVRLNK